MNSTFARYFLRRLIGGKYKVCELCSGPVNPQNPRSHVCVSQDLPLRFLHTPLTSTGDLEIFEVRNKRRGAIRLMKFWARSYINAIETVVEDFELGISKKSHAGIPREEDYCVEIRFRSGEFISDVKFGADVHGLYALKLITNFRRVFEIGNTLYPLKKLDIGNGMGVVGVFGGISQFVTHVGVFLDNTRTVNFSKNRNLLLIKYKGSHENETVKLIRRLDPYLFRYLASFL